MKEYNYSDIVKVDKRGILFSDAEFMEFEDCRREWAKENNISRLELTVMCPNSMEMRDILYFILRRG